MDAYDGYAISKGIKKSEGERLTAEEIDELNRMMEEEEARMAARAGDA